MSLDVHGPPWNYNPSKWTQRIPVIVLGLVAFFIAGYLAAFQWGWVDSIWDPVFGNESNQVLSSDVAHRMHRMFRIPDAALGAFAYLGDAILALAGSTRRWQCRPWLVVLFGLDVIPLGIVSALLVVLQGAVVGSWCFLCLITAVISLILVLLAYDEVWSCLLYLRHIWQNSRSPILLWNTFWGFGSREADEIGNAFLKKWQARYSRIQESHVASHH